MNDLLVTEWFLPIYFSQQQRDNIIARNDPVRYGSILLAMEQIKKENIFGSFAECGVYKGTLSKFIHDTCPDRILYLFDTFEGFDKRDLESGEDSRFSDTDIESVQRYIGGNNNIKIRKGFFPETTASITGEKFSLVILDFDKYNPTLAGLNFFYPLMNSGGFIFVHEYSSPESNWACSRALNSFLIGKPEKPILIPDSWGSAIIRKI
ncbi:MAG: class I SAM-dependent methyltransferase [Bacteroidetes bacterium]|nr:class I SAM-dependent methyltransferase [Bacteroidota bacterium]